MIKLEKYKPAVTKNVLLFLAGFLWACVGTMLLFLAFSWLINGSHAQLFLSGGTGIFFALLIHHFGFLKIVDKNLDRILPMTTKQCLFAFIPGKSYLIIAVMIAMGAVLRHSAIPKSYLAVLYTAIGLALLLSSVRYLRIFFKGVKKP